MNILSKEIQKIYFSDLSDLTTSPNAPYLYVFLCVISTVRLNNTRSAQQELFPTGIVLAGARNKKKRQK